MSADAHLKLCGIQISGEQPLRLAASTTYETVIHTASTSELTTELRSNQGLGHTTR